MYKKDRKKPKPKNGIVLIIEKFVCSKKNRKTVVGWSHFMVLVVAAFSSSRAAQSSKVANIEMETAMVLYTW